LLMKLNTSSLTPFREPLRTSLAIGRSNDGREAQRIAINTQDQVLRR
jgi:hypothetical protein